MSSRWWTGRWLAATIAVLGLLALAALFPAGSSAGASLSQLGQQLDQQRAHAQQLQSSLGRLSGLISSLNSQISLLRSREASVQVQLSQDRNAMAATQSQLQRQRRVLALLEARLAQARRLLSAQLVSNYESSSPDLVDVVLESNGFSDLLERVTFLKDAMVQQQHLISVTRADKARTDAAARRLAKLEARQQAMAHSALIESRALAGMNQLLASRQATLEHTQAIQRSSLSSSQSRASQLQGQISQIEAQQAAQRAAAQQASTPAAAPASSTSSSSGATSYGPWAIPAAIVMCESGGQNLPPNSAGASGYYQILPSTWTEYGGTGPAAYLAPKSEQDQVAARIWNGGAGASAWVCASIVGIH